MKTRHPVYLVQDHGSGLFLAPENGSVGFVQLARHAGEFDDPECALLTALDWCDSGFTILTCITDTETSHHH